LAKDAIEFVARSRRVNAQLHGAAYNRLLRIETGDQMRRTERFSSGILFCGDSFEDKESTELFFSVALWISALEENGALAASTDSNWVDVTELPRTANSGACPPHEAGEESASELDCADISA
jgi:hypothetical protein